jgi:2-C-methyl-D-erythritol 2,4-cyclodiphosphate synthase
MRVGIGYDVHPLVAGRKLVLGGVEIPGPKGLSGHSDGDVLIHAVSDAVLGAMCEDDIGVHFPDTDETIRGIDSREILHHVMKIARNKGFTVSNVDVVVAAQEPRIHPVRHAIRESLAGILGIDLERVSVKGKTTEGLGFVGRREGIAVYAVALLQEEP